MSPVIYKILREPEWQAANTEPLYRGSADDIKSGFIHFSTAEQLSASIKKHFQKEKTLYITAFMASDFPPDILKWEKARNGSLFPHVYGPINIKRAKGCKQIAGPAKAGAAFDLSDDLTDFSLSERIEA